MYDLKFLLLLGIRLCGLLTIAACFALLPGILSAAWLFVTECGRFRKDQSSDNSQETGETDMLKKNSFDLIIVGAGLTGCTLALEVTRRYGFKVLLIEKQWGDSNVERIVGELMQPGGMRVLEEFGLHDIIQNEIDAVPHFGYVMELPQQGNGPNEKLVLRYPEKYPASFKESFGFMPLQAKSVHPMGKALSEEIIKKFCDPQFSQAEMPRAFAFHNYSLLKRLRERCSKNMLITCIRGNVINFVEDRSKPFTSTKISNLEKVIGVIYQEEAIESGSTDATSSPDDKGRSAAKSSNSKVEHMCYAHLTFLCDGGHTLGLRRSYNDNFKLQKVSSWVGILLTHEQWSTPLSNPGYACVLLLDPSPLLLYQISPTETRCLICVDGDVSDLTDYLHECILPNLPNELVEPFKKALKERKFLVKNSYRLSPSSSSKLGLLALGDALNMRHALTGCGMTVCLNDVKLVIRIMQTVDIRKATASKEMYHLFERQRKSYAGTLNILADALHVTVSLHDGKEEERRALRSACFKYLKKGGFCSAGPIG
ncbi:putative Squalene monooxygenase [Cardiosporidium cionae]|uniref:Squalene monooxygenase n=1 Tax=Cardiosporidium cionae TaxID=476202 RepID=A0ABQ7J6B6_9APIC|nr:putative Squalene monooxygenase [Cardiosporidium cionae]|eukprot:KAF8819517.1 putative Squalene monooxygenase [Cardiosporidium cionae]